MSSNQSGGPEYLEQGGGRPLHDDRPAVSGGRSGRRTALLAGGGVLGLALVGGGVWAATSFLGTGAQPAEALPASTIGYASIDLDPSGAQKIEALRTLRTFPAFRDKVGLETTDDMRRKIVESIAEDSGCDLDYATDVEPWIGNRAAVAAVDIGAKQPSPVVVLQVTDEGKADAGLAKLRDCGSEHSGGWTIKDGWAVLGASETTARQVVTDAADAPLSDDGDFQKWSGEVGDAGIVSMYAAPGAGQFLADNLGGMGGMAGMSGMAGDTSAASAQLESFKGAAATIRFHDGSVELEVAGEAGKDVQLGDQGGDMVSTLPADTAAAIGLQLGDGWFTKVVDQMAASSGGQMTSQDFLSMASQQTGLDLPADAETLAGDSLAVGVGRDFDMETLANSSDGSGVPVAVKVHGDGVRIESVLDKVRGQAGPAATMLQSDRDGDVVVVGPDAAYRKAALGDGDLGSSDAFTRVVPHAKDASGVFFLDLDALGDKVGEMAGDPQVSDNLAPLQALDMSFWKDGDTGRGLLRITTD